MTPSITAPLYRNLLNQAQIDAQYNPGVDVPDVPAQARHYAEVSAVARQRLRSTLDLPFGPTRAETLDIFPADTPGAPVFIFLHGGYWRALSSKDFSGVALGLQPRGITTVVVNYALCPVVTIDEIVRQVRAAVAWVLRHIHAHGGDPARVAIGGHSAGAHLSAMCLQTPWSRDYDLPDDPFRAALLVSGVFDIAPLRYSYLQPQIQLDDGVIRRCSPLFSVRSSPAPALVTWGTAESSEFARQSTDFGAAWQAAGNAAEFMPQAGANHYTALHGLERPDSPLCDWLAQQLGA
jgi:arylformamidase